MPVTQNSSANLRAALVAEASARTDLQQADPNDTVEITAKAQAWLDRVDDLNAADAAARAA